MKKILFFVLLSCYFNTFAQQISFNGKGLLYLIDADFNAFSYSTTFINKDRVSQDKIGAVAFPLDFENKSLEQPISNSIISNKKLIEIRPNSQLCYVLETKTPIGKEESGTTIPYKRLGSGAYVSVVDISNLHKISPDYRFPVAINATSMSLNKQGNYLAVGSEAINRELQVYEMDEIGKPIKIITQASQIVNGPIIDVKWHPSGDFLCFIKKNTKEIGILKVIRDASNKIDRFELHGNLIRFEGFPLYGEFTPDGKYFVMLDAKHNPNAKDLMHKSEIFVIKFNLDQGGSHYLVSKTDLDNNATSFAIHPSGNWLVSLNLKESFEYPVKPSITNNASISVCRLSQDGAVFKINTFPIQGILPSSIIFDKTGDNIAIANFQYYNYGKAIGGIDFFSFNINQNGKIENQNSSIFTNLGVHYLKLVSEN